MVGWLTQLFQHFLRHIITKMTNLAKQSSNLPKNYNLDVEGRRSTWDKMYLGIVKDNQDERRQQRIKVWIAELCKSPPEEESGWIIVDYASMFAGTTGGSSYGANFTPQIGDQVICGFINGDPGRGFWFAMLPKVNQNRGIAALPGNGGKTLTDPPKTPTATTPQVNTPTSSSAGSAALNAQSGNTATRPAVGTVVPAPPSPAGGPDPRLSASQTNSLTANDPVLGPSTYGVHNSYNINGITTPGGNAFTMSDQPNDTQIRITTRNNMQLIMHNELDLMVLSTGSGGSRIELHGDGKIVIYGQGNVNIRGTQDINLHADRDLNMEAGGKIQLRSQGDTLATTVTGSMHFYSNSRIHMMAAGDFHRLAIGNIHDSAHKEFSRNCNGDMYDTSIGGTIYCNAFNNIDFRAANNVNVYTSNDIHLQTVNGQLSIKSGTNVLVQSDKSTNILSGKAVNIESDGGDTNILSKAGINLQNNGKGNWQSGLDLSLQSQVDLNIRGNPGVNIDSAIFLGKNLAANAGGVSSGATPALLAEKTDQEAVPAMSADQVTVNPFVDTNTKNQLYSGASAIFGGGGVNSSHVISSITSSLPGAAPTIQRYSVGPGFSNTGTVERSDTVGAGYNVGQIEANQTVPLQCMGYIGKGAGITSAGDAGIFLGMGLNYNIAIAAQAIHTQYGLMPSSTVRPADSASQHSIGNAVDFVIASLSVEQKNSLFQQVVNGITTGIGPFRYIRGVGLDDGTGTRVFHIDCRTHCNRTNTPNDVDVFGPTYSKDSVPYTDPLFQQYFTGFLTGALVPGVPQSQQAAAAPGKAPTGEEALRWIGTSYSGGTPQYAWEQVPNWTFQPASQYTGLSTVGAQDIMDFEGMKGPKPDDVYGHVFENICGGVKMIGFGHKLSPAEISSNQVTINGANIDITKGITEAQATSLFQQDIVPFVNTVKSAITNPITQQQFDSLVDFCWSIGIDKFKTSQVVQLINNKQYDSVPTEMTRWVVACGNVRAELQSRRKAMALRFAGVLRAETPLVVGPTGGGLSSNPGSEAAAMAWFQSPDGGGYTKAQAAGIVANLIAESTLRPTAQNLAGGGNGALGIAQWRAGRQTDLCNFCGVPNVLLATFEQQLGFVSYELATKYSRAHNELLASQDPQSAADVITRWYEVPTTGDMDAYLAMHPERRNTAVRLYNSY
jgi:lysozyme